MKINPTVTRFVDRAKATTPPNTLAKANEESESFAFARISPGHYVCGSGDITYIIIDKDEKIGCSCGDMTHRCTGTDVCKHIAAYTKLDVPPQSPVLGEIVNKLLIMGWEGGTDNLHPAKTTLQQRADDANESNGANKEMVHYTCPKCGEEIDTEKDKLTDWKLNHIDVCTGRKDVKSRAAAPYKKPPTPAPSVSPPAAEKVSAVAPPAAIPTVPGIYDDATPHDAPSAPTTVPPNLATALCNMQKTELLAVADSDNPFHNSKYANLSSVWAAIRKPLTDNGLAIIQTTEPYPKGVTVVTTLTHTSGESVTARISSEVAQSKPDKNGMIKPNIQGLGSTITYLRRYALAAMVGVSAVDDDDGEAAMGRDGNR